VRARRPDVRHRSAGSSESGVFGITVAWHRDCSGVTVVTAGFTRWSPGTSQSARAGRRHQKCGWRAAWTARPVRCASRTPNQHSSKRVVSQAQADRRCASAAQRRDSPAAGSTFAASGVIVLVPVAAFIVPVSTFMSQQWRALVPLPVSSTPKHLLLSVLPV
jgi:hypothetical protein